MWISNIRWGVLCLATPVGVRYVRPAFLERLYLMWLFRHFSVLPQKVMSGHAQALIENICARQHTGPDGSFYSITDQPVIGTVERGFQVADQMPTAKAGSISARAAALSRRIP